MKNLQSLKQHILHNKKIMILMIILLIIPMAYADIVDFYGGSQTGDGTGNVIANAGVGYIINTSSTFNIGNLSFEMLKVGSPACWMNASIRINSSNTIIDWSANVTCDSVSNASYVNVTFTFTNHSQIVAGTLYKFIIFQVPIGNATAMFNIKYKDAQGAPYAQYRYSTTWSETLSQAGRRTNYYIYNYSFPLANTTPSYYVNISQSPKDINSTSDAQLNISVSVKNNNTYANVSNNSASFTTLYFMLNSSIFNECIIFYGKACHISNGVYYASNMTKLNATDFLTSLDDDEYLPALYPYNYTYISNTLGNNLSVYLLNYIKYNIFNFSTSSEDYLIHLEFDAFNQSSNAMAIYYCNSTYTTGSPLINGNCELVDSFLPFNLTRHRHNFSNEYGIPIRISIAKTQISYFIFMSSGNASSGWKFRYVTAPDYDNTSFNYGNTATWANTSAIFDIHVHEFKDNDYIKYYATYNDGNGFSNTSSTVIDFYNITNYPPSATTFNTTLILTVTHEFNTTLTISWLPSQDVNNDTINYLLYEDATLLYNGTNTSFIYSTNANTTIGYYSMILYSCDPFNCDHTIDTFYACINNWVMSPQQCIGGVELINYTDSNSCNAQYGIPSNSGEYTACNLTSNVSFSFSDNTLILIIMALLFIIFFISAALFTPFFLIGDGLVMGITSFLLYDLLQATSSLYASIIFIMSLIIAILFIIGGIYLGMRGKIWS